jgi:predicted Zn-dependent protease
MPSPSSTSAPSRAAELRTAGLQIGAALLVFAAIYGLYAREVKVEEEVQLLLAGPRGPGGVRAGGVRSALNQDTPAGLLAAEKGLRAALELQPSNPYAVAAFADVEALLVEAGFDDRAQAADDALARAEAKGIEKPERFEAHALRLLQEGKAGEAETALLALLAKYGSVPQAIDALGLAQRQAGKLAEARSAFRKAQEADWRSPRKVAHYAAALLEEGSPAEAAATFDRALQAHGGHLRSMLGKALALAALARAGRPADLEAARGLVESVLSRSPGELAPKLRARALAVKAEVLLAAGGDGAASALEAQRLAPQEPQVLRALALTAPARNADAPRAWRAALQADPSDASLYFDGAEALQAAGAGAAAEELLGAYAAALPKTARYHLALARLQLARGDVKAAEAGLAKAEALEPASALVALEQGRAAQRRRDAKGAIAAYERAAQLRDDLPEVYRQMGALYLENRAVPEGLRAYLGAAARYRAGHARPTVLEGLYDEVSTGLAKAGQAGQYGRWVAEARGAR